jgi:hypothetical protein
MTNAELDAEVEQLIKAGWATAMEIEAMVSNGLANPMRAVDASLQRLRKRGSIRSVNRRWVPVAYESDYDRGRRKEREAILANIDRANGWNLADLRDWLRSRT